MANLTEAEQEEIVRTGDDAVLSGGEGLGGFIDEASLENDQAKAARRNRGPTEPFRRYIERVVQASRVPDAHETRAMTSHICGVVAALPFVPDHETLVDRVDGDGNPIFVLDGDGQRVIAQTTEFEQQIVKTARDAEVELDSKMVWTASAMKIARVALELRRDDPDGSKGRTSQGREGAWVNDAHPGIRQRLAAAA